METMRQRREDDDRIIGLYGLMSKLGSHDNSYRHIVDVDTLVNDTASSGRNKLTQIPQFEMSVVTVQGI